MEKQFDLLGLKEKVQKAYESHDRKAVKRILQQAWHQVKDEWENLSHETRMELNSMFDGCVQPDSKSQLFKSGLKPDPSRIVESMRTCKLVKINGKMVMQWSPRWIHREDGMVESIGKDERENG
jgi:hypothetical protein